MFTRVGQPTLCCGAVCGGGIQEGTMLLGQLSAGIQSPPLLPTSRLGSSGADSWVDGIMCILGHCGPLQQALLCGWEFLLPTQFPPVYSVRCFEALFPPYWNPGWHGLSCSPVVPPSLSTCKCGTTLSTSYQLVHPLPPCLPGPLVTTLSCASSLPWLPTSTPPTSLNECFFFNSLVVGLA